LVDLGGKKVEDISTSYGQTCVITDNGEVWCWGRYYWGQEHDYHSYGTAEHIEINSSLEAVTISIAMSGADTAACAVMNDSSGYCWGNNYHRQLNFQQGVGTSTWNEPRKIDGGNEYKYIKVAGTANRACAITVDDDINCWGWNFDGTENLSLGLEYTTDISLDQISLCVLTSQNNIYCLGSNSLWGLGNSSVSYTSNFVPINTSQDASFVALSGGDVARCALEANSSLYCWGDSWDGETGIGKRIEVPNPTEVIFSSGRFPVANSSYFFDDEDNYTDYYENDCGSDPTDASSIPPDNDEDNYCDEIDEDDDNDWWTDTVEATCGSDGLDNNSTPADFDGDHICDLMDADDDWDGVDDDVDAFPYDPSEWNDNDMDGIGDNADTDDDNDNWFDSVESDCGTDPMNETSIPDDFDIDGVCDPLDDDDDNDSVNDTDDAFPYDPTEWNDNDMDGIGDNADTDDDDDNWFDSVESDCGTDPMNEASIPDDFDSDGVCDPLDEDDDNDGVNDSTDVWPFDPCVSLDYDSDGLADLLNYIEDCETLILPDLDHDNDMVVDTDDFCWYGDLNWTSGAILGTDHDGDGCRDDGEDTDDDGDGVEDSDDQCPRGHTGWISNPVNDIDGDGCHETEDYDIDGDGFSDVEDAFPEDPEEWFDSDDDGVGDNSDAYPNDSSRWEIGDDERPDEVEDDGYIITILAGTILVLIIALVVVLKRK
jgi:hypothetical protein